MAIDTERILNTSILFDRIGQHRVRCDVDPDNRIAESDESNNTAEIVIHVNEGTLKLSSNPFTPNNDGFNDYVFFEFPEMFLKPSEVLIFDLYGKKVRTIRSNGDEYRWYGSDDNGQELLPGVYIYIIRADGKSEHNGTLTLIRQYVLIIKVFKKENSLIDFFGGKENEKEFHNRTYIFGLRRR